MGFLRRPKDVLCPVCGVVLGSDRAAIYRDAHLLSHLEDRPGDRLAIPCGHPDAEWSVNDDFPTKVVDHVWSAHR